MLKYAIAAALCGSTLISLPAFGQEESTSKSDIFVEASLPFVKTTNADGAQQSASVNYGFLGGYRYFFKKHSGVEVSYGYTHTTQTYSLDSGSTGVKNNSDESYIGNRFSTARISQNEWIGLHFLFSRHFNTVVPATCFWPVRLSLMSKYTENNWLLLPRNPNLAFNNQKEATSDEAELF